jgi:GDPmannose 4,6-dehydratase
MATMRVLVIGPFGQDAHFIFSALSTKPNVKLYGVNHSESSERFAAFKISHPSVQVQVKDLSKKSECKATLDAINPLFIFHLAAVHSSVNMMHLLNDEQALAMWNCHHMITENLIDWMSHNRESRLIFAASSQVFAGHKSGTRICESSQPLPVNEYGKSKFASWQLIQEARESLNLHLSCGILFNHTSEFSKSEFLFPNLVEQVVQIIEGRQSVIKVRNQSSFIDISYAGEIAIGLIAMAECKNPGDYVLGSGNSSKVSRIVEKALTNLGLETHKISLQSTEALNEERCLVSDPTKARKILGWKVILAPDEILTRMVQARVSLR